MLMHGFKRDLWYVIVRSWWTCEDVKLVAIAINYMLKPIHVF